MNTLLTVRQREIANPPLGSILPLSLDEVDYAAGGQRLLKQITVELRYGVRTVLLGPNGAGKSLLLRLCHGLLQPTAGTVRWSDGNQRRLRSQQAMVFQRPVLLRRSVAANVEYALAAQGLSRRLRRQRASQALQQVGLAQLAHRPARVLSGGEQQRLALARAWALQPQVLFLDEPTANLDPAATRRIEAIIEIIHGNGTKIIMATHDLGQARRHADEVLFLHRGRLLEQTPASRFFARPDTAEAQVFLAGDLLD